MQVVILANGEFPTHKTAVEILLKAHRIVCCDGAFAQLMQSGLYSSDMNITVIGDGDSLPVELRQKCKDFIQVAEQDTNDLTKATRYCVSQGLTDIVYLGATGLREDHTLGNLSLLVEYLTDYHCKVRMVTNYGVFTPIQETTIFQSFPKQQVSLFSADSQNPLSSTGLEYPLNQRCLTSFWQGTLNSALGTEFTIQTAKPVLVYQTHDPK